MKEKKTKIMLAEDDQNLGMLLKEYLIAKGYETDLYIDGEKAYYGFINNHFDICILDVMMPKKDGFSLAKDIRLNNKDVPIIFLTAKSMKQDVFEGFKSGADDYISKPFSMEELLFRIEAILRRTRKDAVKEDQTLFQLGAFSFDSHRQILANPNTNSETKLTTKESDLLKMLCQHANEILERNYALKAIWFDDNYFNARSMDVYITKLRKYLKDEPGIEIINVHGKGYKLVI
jgi:two-component system, OmpR family, response regulator